jgi:CubicO group peptidase (beta-lactamase class C family)
MKTRVIQDEPEDPASRRSSSAPPEARPQSTEQAALMGRWSPRQRRIAIWAALAAVILGAAYLVTRPGSDTPAANGAGAGPQFAAIERFVQHEMAAQRIPGLAPGIVKGNRIVYTRGFGKADGHPGGIMAPPEVGAYRTCLTLFAAGGLR